MATTGKCNMKRTFFEKIMIITSGLSKYPKIGKTMEFQDLEWTTRGGVSYFPDIMREFYVNYITTLENICKKRYNTWTTKTWIVY